MLMRFLAIATGAAILAAAPSRAPAQDAYPQEAQSPLPPALAPSALDQLVAPVALYPDALLAQVLAAATYPLEVVQAHRWIGQPQNASLTNGALTEAVAAQNWDPSVQELIPFPPVLQLMDDHLDWTEQLGEAFLAQPDDVMSAVQRLRHRAEQAGTLRISAQQSVVNEGGDIAITPPDDQTVYVPTYDAQCVYGPWPYTAAGPVDFGPWNSACGAGSATLDYSETSYLPFGFFLWASFDWRHHCIRIDRQRFSLAHPGKALEGDVWRHDPAHRRGAVYVSRLNAQHFGSAIHAGGPPRAPGASLGGAYNFAPAVVRGTGVAPRLHEGFAGRPGGVGMQSSSIARAPAAVGHPSVPTFAAPAQALAGHGMTGH
jgi:hypothetical protein